MPEKIFIFTEEQKKASINSKALKDFSKDDQKLFLKAFKEFTEDVATLPKLINSIKKANSILKMSKAFVGNFELSIINSHICKTINNILKKDSSPDNCRFCPYVCKKASLISIDQSINSEERAVRFISYLKQLFQEFEKLTKPNNNLEEKKDEKI